MGRLTKAMYHIYELEELAEKPTRINQVHPLIKLVVTVIDISCVVSMNKYNIIGLLFFFLYPLMLFYLSAIPIGVCIRKIRIFLPFLCVIGIFNPFYDHTPVIIFGKYLLSGGIISLITLMIKGMLTLMAAFLLIATTGMERICYAFRLLHTPGMIVTQVLLTYRYITLLLKEANAVMEAYSLRAPKHKGVKYKVWGTLLGQLLFRSMDRAENLYESMLLRGFHGEFYYASQQKVTTLDYIYLLLWLVILTGLRIIHFSGF